VPYTVVASRYTQCRQVDAVQPPQGAPSRTCDRCSETARSTMREVKLASERRIHHCPTRWLIQPPTSRWRLPRHTERGGEAILLHVRTSPTPETQAQSTIVDAVGRISGMMRAAEARPGGVEKRRNGSLQSSAHRTRQRRHGPRRSRPGDRDLRAHRGGHRGELAGHDESFSVRTGVRLDPAGEGGRPGTSWLFVTRRARAETPTESGRSTPVVSIRHQASGASSREQHGSGVQRRRAEG